LFKAIVKLLKALNGNVKKSQIAAGIAWGLLLGLVPIGNFFWIVLFVASFFFTHHHGGKIFGLFIVKLLSPIFILGIDALGWQVLHIGALQPLFTTLYNMPFVPFTKFNNTLVAGGLVSGIVLWLPFFYLFMALIPLYRNKLGPKLRENKIVKKILNFPLFKLIDGSISTE